MATSFSWRWNGFTLLTPLQKKNNIRLAYNRREWNYINKKEYENWLQLLPKCFVEHLWIILNGNIQYYNSYVTYKFSIKTNHLKYKIISHQYFFNLYTIQSNTHVFMILENKCFDGIRVLIITFRFTVPNLLHCIPNNMDHLLRFHINYLFVLWIHYHFGGPNNSCCNVIFTVKMQIKIFRVIDCNAK